MEGDVHAIFYAYLHIGHRRDAISHEECYVSFRIGIGMVHSGDWSPIKEDLIASQ